MPRPAPFVGVYDHPKHTMTKDVFRVLSHYGIPFRTLTRDDLAALRHGMVDVLLLPGGWYFFDAPVNDRIRAFVRGGGGYVGICCGQINACKLGLVRTKMFSMYGMGPCYVEPVLGRHPVLRGVVRRSKAKHRAWDRIDMLRYNGWPMLPPAEPRAWVIAAYDIDKELAAIVAAEYGKGRVVAFSPHPEGCIGKPGEFRDRDRLPIAYDPFEMNTAPMLANAIDWTARRPVPAKRP